jgi:glutamyl-tRNA reductase
MALKMGLTYKDKEEFESWVERVRMFEYGRALQELARGKDPETVMEEMSRNIIKKCTYPVYMELKKVDKDQ